MKKTVGLLTGGGDVPGLNPCMKAFVLSALESGCRVIGIRRGWGGLLNYNINDPSGNEEHARELSATMSAPLIVPGTFLHTPDQPQREKRHPAFLKGSSLGRAVDDAGTMDYRSYQAGNRSPRDRRPGDHRRQYLSYAVRLREGSGGDPQYHG